MADALTCPRCRLALQDTVVEDAGVSASAQMCPKCNGKFFEKGALDALKEVVKVDLFEFRAIPSERTQMAPLSCPSCNNDDPMLKVVSDRDDAVTLDVCPRCRGTWVDKGELQAMQTETLFGLFRLIKGWFR